MSEQTSNWSTFESRLAHWSRELAGMRLTCRNGYQAIPGFPPDGFRADALLTDGRRLIAVEIEGKQKHPDTNVGKYWLLADYHRYERVVLFHIYTPAFNSYPWRKRLGEFYARKMQDELPFEYVQVDLRKETDIESALERVTKMIEARVLLEFPANRQLLPTSVQLKPPKRRVAADGTLVVRRLPGALRSKIVER